MNPIDAISSADLEGSDYVPSYSCDDCGADIPAPGLCDDCAEQQETPRRRLTRQEKEQG